jgi:hypothetical protein
MWEEKTYSKIPGNSPKGTEGKHRNFSEYSFFLARNF